MELALGVTVKCLDDRCGESTRIVMNPVSQSVTHLVVDAGRGAGERVVPVDMVTETEPEQIRLRCSAEELRDMPEFDASKYVAAESSEERGIFMLPYAFPEDEVVSTQDTVPPAELAIRRGAPVHATDGRIGDVSEFLVDPVDGHITHLILSEGHIWERRDVTIPINHIERIESDAVVLDLSKAEVEDLPALRVRRWLPTLG